MTFRTVRISNPQYEFSSLRFVTVKSANLKGRGDICIYVPHTEQDELPIVVLLHGVYGSAWSWALAGGVHITASELIKKGTIRPMIIAMPSDGLWGDGSAYLPHHSRDFEKWISNDVLAAVTGNIKKASSSSKAYISGLSMGGFGALRIGAKYPGVFDAFSAHSAITRLDQMPLFVEENLVEYGDPPEEDADVFKAIINRRQSLRPFRFDCGKDDLLVEYNRELHKNLESAEIEHEYLEFEGCHEWPYWQKNVTESLLFFNQQLNNTNE